MNMTRAILAALRGDPEVMNELLRARIEVEQGPLSTVVRAAEALQPVLERSVSRKPSKLGKLSLKSAHILAGLASEDRGTNELFARVARGSTVGIVFVDIAGFTTYTEKHGDEAAIELLTRMGGMVERALTAGRGECVKKLGDGFLLVFPSASQAVRAALQLRDIVERNRREEQGLRVRIAVHAGEPLIEGNDLLGHDVNLTARLLDHCKPGKVIVSEPAKELAEKRLQKVVFGKARTTKIAGLASRVRTYLL